MSVKCFLDTNILIYAFSDDNAKADRALHLLSGGGYISVQVLNEFVNVCRKKLKLGWEEIEERLAIVKTLASDVIPLSIGMHESAVKLARDHGFSIYDAVIVAAAVAGNCDELLSEDMQHGRIVLGVAIKNPFATPTGLGP